MTRHDHEAGAELPGGVSSSSPLVAFPGASALGFLFNESEGMAIDPAALKVIYSLSESSVKTIQKACKRNGFRVSAPQIRHARENAPPPVAAIANSLNEEIINRVLALNFPPGYVAQIVLPSKKTLHLQAAATKNREAGRAFGGKV